MLLYSSMAHSTMNRLYQKLLTYAEEDERIIGVILGGSRGKGMINEFSDYDLNFIVDEADLNKFEHKIKKFDSIGDIGVQSIQDFRCYANWNTDFSWDRYNFTHLKAPVDKTGEIQRLIDEKGVVPEEVYESHIRANLDYYINSIYRSVKCTRSGDILGARLEASRGISGYLSVLFGVHNRRLLPYYKYLKWELQRDPLTKLEKAGISGEELLAITDQIMKDGDLKAQHKLFIAIENLVRKEGFGSTLDEWGDNLEFIKNYAFKL